MIREFWEGLKEAAVLAFLLVAIFMALYMGYGLVAR